MFRMLIVDDEPSAVDSIAATLPWTELGIEEVFCAYSGKEALKLFEVNSVDIVMTDIRMPGMDGIELIRRIRQLSPGTACLLVTGYAEFEYAKQAIELQTVEYLLKPVSDEKLLGTIRAVTERLKREWDRVASYNHALNALRTQLPSLRSNLLRELLDRRKYHANALDQDLALFELPMRCGAAVQLMLLRLESSPLAEDLRERNLYEFAVMNIAAEVFGEGFNLWSCKDAHDLLAIALFPKAGGGSGEDDVSRETAARLAVQFQSHVKAYLRGSVSIAVSAVGLFPADLGTIYRDALRLLRRTIPEDEGLLMTVGESQRDPSPAGVIGVLHESPSLFHLFEAGVWEEVRRKLEEAFAELDLARPVTMDHLRQIYHTLSAACYHYAHLNGQSCESLFGEDNLLPHGEHGELSLQRLKDWAFSICDRLFQENRREIQDTRTAIVNKVIDYIHAHLEEDVSLQTLADQVGWHPVHLSKVFKMVTGESLSDYLFRLRMERAIQLLRHSDMKIYEITAKVGYMNTPHFIKVFKKAYGVTPQGFRDNPDSAVIGE